MVNKNLAYTFIGSSLGTILEWYDFSLFMFMLPIIVQHFFPQEHAWLGILLSYSVFAVGYFLRPLGAAVFGHIGDTYGRKKALVYSILCMSIPTSIIAFLPTYAQIGIVAPLILLLLRLLQALSVGGESTGAVIFVYEAYPFKYKGFVCSLLWAMTGIGMILGSTVALYVNKHPDLWRYAFLVGLLTGLVGYIVRSSTHETLYGMKQFHDQPIEKYPVLDCFKHHKKKLVTLMAFYMLSAIITYLIFVFMPIYATQVIGIPSRTASIISTIALLCNCMLVPLGGYLADRFGPYNIMSISASGFILLSYLLFKLIAMDDISGFIVAECGFVLLAMAFQGPITVAALELCPGHIRYSLSSLGYNISYALFGGTAPLVAIALVSWTGNKLAPSYYVMLGAIVALIALLLVRASTKSSQAVLA